MRADGTSLCLGRLDASGASTVRTSLDCRQIMSLVLHHTTLRIPSTWSSSSTIILTLIESRPRIPVPPPQDPERCHPSPQLSVVHQQTSAVRLNRQVGEACSVSHRPNRTHHPTLDPSPSTVLWICRFPSSRRRLLQF